MKEYSLILLKPDAVKQDLCFHVLGRIVHGIEEGRVRASRILRFTPETLREHYSHITYLSVYPAVEQFMLSSEVWASIIEGNEGAIQKIRDMIGATNPDEADEGTIRAQFGKVVGNHMHNVVHSSESQEVAWKEIARFFPREEILNAIPEIADKVFSKSE